MVLTKNNVKILLLDIEGTICPISFVKDTLFPYALKALPEVLKQRWNDKDFAPYKHAFPSDAQSSPEEFLAHVEDLTRRDVKIAYLKNLQGYLWQTGYETGAYATPLFPDVLPVLNNLHDSGTIIAIYSSGSIFAQKLLFAHVSASKGTEQNNSSSTVDATDLIGQLPSSSNIANNDSDCTYWFDTTNAGPKTEAESYRLIVQKMGISNASEILFLSDNVKEVDVALEAGMQSLVIERPGNAPLNASDRERHQVITTLEEIQFA